MAEVQDVIDAFATNGLSLRPAACKFIQKACCNCDNLEDSEKEQWLEHLIRRLTNLDGVDSDVKVPESGIVEVGHIKVAVSEIEEGRGGKEDKKAFSVVDLFNDIPKFVYNAEKKDMVIPAPQSKSILPSSDDQLIRTDMFIRRYQNLKARLKRLKHDMVLSIEATKNSKNQGNVCVTFGVIVKIDQDHFTLEDDTDNIALDMSGTKFIEGCYFIENCFYVLEGFQDIASETFKVLKIALPPIETTDDLRKLIGTKNLFGSKSKRCASSNADMKRIEEANSDIFFCIINELWLDSTKCLENFDKMLSGFIANKMIPAAFIITGNFSCEAHINELVAIRNYQRNFLNFAKNLAEHYRDIAQQSRFIFIPGSKDPGPISNMLPRPTMLNSISQKVQKYLPNVVFSTNPTRIQYCSQEIIVTKLDILRTLDLLTLERQITNPERSHDDKVNDMVKTVKSQAHICPLPIDVQPIVDTRDHTLEIPCFPDLLVYGQGALNIRQFNRENVCSPGSFGERGLFQVYFPASREVQESEV